MTTNSDRVLDLLCDVDGLRRELDEWGDGRRDPGRPHQRLAGADALNDVDRALRELHAIRAQLITQVRRYDDESMRRTDALLRRIDAERTNSDVQAFERDQQLGRERRGGDR